MSQKVAAIQALLTVLQVCGVLSSELSSRHYQGDIVLTLEQQATLERTSNPNDPLAPQNAFLKSTRYQWSDAVVPYTLDSSLGTMARGAIQEAIDEYRRHSCVKLVPRANEGDYVQFFVGDGCYSNIGRAGGRQRISIGRGCEYKGIVMHEIFHALGRFHEQSRPDRDMFIKINLQNVKQGLESQFDITRLSYVTTQGIPYDFKSVMHYGAYAFSIDRRRLPTIEPLDSNIPLSELGQREGFSPSDIVHVNTLYCGGGTPSGTWSSWTVWSGCSQTCNGGQRTRTRTCVGGTACQGSNIDTDICNTRSCPVPAIWGSWSSWGICSTTCGGGRQQRTRRCVGGNTCVGARAEFRDCNTRSCPQSAMWGSWGSWSACSSTCQGGVRQRFRRCENGNTCTGETIRTEFCNSNTPCTSGPNPNAGEWSQWSQCTKTCGGGRRFRTMNCGSTTTSNCRHERQRCNTQPCNPEPHIRGVNHVGCYHVPYHRGIGLMEGLTPDLSDNPRTRTNPIQKCGMAAQQYNYAMFAVSTGYCISGSNREFYYTSSGESVMCHHGVGGYNNVTHEFMMDVYRITDATAFRDSLTQVAMTTSSSRLTQPTDSSGNAGRVGNGGAHVVMNVGVTMLLGCWLFAASLFY